jgi:hypothetical protein
MWKQIMFREFGFHGGMVEDSVLLGSLVALAAPS